MLERPTLRDANGHGTPSRRVASFRGYGALPCGFSGFACRQQANLLLELLLGHGDVALVLSLQDVLLRLEPRRVVFRFQN